MRRLRSILVLAALATLLLSVGIAWATTGATTGYPQPKEVVPSSVAAPFEGRYVMTETGSGANLRSGEVKMEFEEGSSPQFLVGISEFYEYSPSGELEIGLFSFYPFKQLPNGKGLSAEVLKQTASATYGQLVPAGELQLFTQKNESTLRGTLKLHGGGPWPIVFHRLADSESTGGNPPAAKQIAEAGEPTNPGWGPKGSEYEGEYELMNAAEDPTEDAGTLGAVIGVAQGLGVKQTVVTGGSMKIEGKPATAEVTVETGSEARAFTLTNLAWEGDARVAQVHTEGANGPAVGRFEGTERNGVVKGSLGAGHSLYQLTFKHQG